MLKGCIHIEFLINLINTIFCSCQTVNYCKQSSSTGLGAISAFSSLVCVPPREGTAGCEQQLAIKLTTGSGVSRRARYCANWLEDDLTICKKVFLNKKFTSNSFAKL